jgi:hypothetical protein
MFNLRNISCIIFDYTEDLSQLVHGYIMDKLSASILRVQKIQKCFVGPTGGTDSSETEVTLLFGTVSYSRRLESLTLLCKPGILHSLSLFTSSIMYLMSLLGSFQQKFQWAFSCYNDRLELKIFISIVTPYQVPFQPSSHLHNLHF